jgi:4-amino-4-deoxy-L-arabinose transferase-like glycosyltransferase
LIFIQKKYFLLSMLLILHAGFWIIRKPPQPSSDDLVYLINAKHVLTGEYSLNESPKNHRLVVFAPVAFFINLFGESPWIVSLWPFICSCITLITLFFFLIKNSSPLHGFAATFILACNTLQIDYSASLFPDVIVAMFSLLFLVDIYEARSKQIGYWKSAISATLFFYLGFLSKEIIIFLLPFVFFLFISDVRKRINFNFWKKFIPLMIGAGCILLGVYYYTTGEINFLYHSIDTRHSELYEIRGINILKRITYEPVLMFAGNVGFAVLFLFLIHFMISWKREKSKNNRLINFFAGYLLILLIVYWFLPISFTHFTLIQLDARMWMLLLVPLCILAGHTASNIIEDKNSILARRFIIFFAVAALIALVFVSPQRALMFMSFALSSTLMLFLKQRGLKEIWLMIIFLSPAIVLALRFTMTNSNFLIR